MTTETVTVTSLSSIISHVGSGVGQAPTVVQATAIAVPGPRGPRGIQGPPGECSVDTSSMTIRNGILSIDLTKLGSTDLSQLLPGHVYVTATGELAIITSLEEIPDSPPFVVARMTALQPGTDVDLTALGTLDWAFFGEAAGSAALTNLERKDVAESLIGTVAKIGSGTVARGAPNISQTGGFYWTDGTTVTSSSNRANGLSITGESSGLSITLLPQDEPYILDVFFWRQNATSEIALTTEGLDETLTDGMTTSSATPSSMRLTAVVREIDDPLVVQITLASDAGSGLVALHALTCGETAPTQVADLAAAWEYVTSLRNPSALHVSGTEWDLPTTAGQALLERLHREFDYTVSWNL